MLRLAMLGWTQKEIGELLGVAQRTVSDDLSRNCETAKNAIRDLASQHIERHEIARRFNLPPVLCGSCWKGGNLYEGDHQAAEQGWKKLVDPYRPGL